MDIKSVKFIKSSPDISLCPKPGFPEFAFAGRSNTGKSSLINFLVNLKKLAKTSSTPGKTRLINHFLVNESWYLVDLPGYGYARGGDKSRMGFVQVMQEYLLQRQSLACLFLLIDCRHAPLSSDLEIIHWLGVNQIPFAIVFTKTDKLSAGRLERNTEHYKNVLLKSWEILPAIFKSSSLAGTGREEILEYIQNSLQGSVSNV